MKRLEEINKVVAEFYGLDPKSRGYLISRKKYGNKTLPRQVAQFIARDSYKYTLEKIGNFYNLGHDTIISSTKSVDSILSYDAGFRMDILTMKKSLGIFNLDEMIRVRDDLNIKISEIQRKLNDYDNI